MKKRWPDLGQSGLLVNWVTQRTLIDYEGPQMVLVEDAGRKSYLGIAADEDDRAVRWVFTSVSHLELRALFDGIIRTREAYRKPRVLVVDVPHEDGPKTVNEVDGILLSEQVLPTAGAILPRMVRDAFKEPQPAGRTLTIGGASVPSGRVAFRDLALVVSDQQRLWSALYFADQGGAKRRGKLKADASKAQLYMEASAPGSFVVKMAPEDDGTFERIAAEYRTLLDASDNRDQLRAQIGRVGVRAVSAYESMLNNLERRGLEVMTRWSTGAAYISQFRARVVLPALREAQTQETGKFEAVGQLSGLSFEKNSFDFVDFDDEGVISGILAPDFEYLPKDGKGEIKIGETIYLGQFETRIQRVGEQTGKQVTTLHKLIENSEDLVTPSDG